MKKRALLFIVGLVAITTGKSQIQGYSVGQTVANFTVTDTDGNSHTLYNITATGKYVVLDFFFTTCVPCQSTQPYFNELHDKYGCNQGDLFCISINTGQDNDAAVINFENTYGGSFEHSPAVSGDGGSAAVDNVFSPAAYPTYCLIGPDNTLLNADIWPISNVGSFEAAFPAGSNITPMACSVGQPDVTITALPVMKLYPNPAISLVNVDLGELITKENLTLEVTDLAGRVVTTQAVSDATNSLVTLDVNNLTEGTYMLVVKSNNVSITNKKLVITR
jgi:thiol-disulfide isomerase/thioredoxin